MDYNNNLENSLNLISKYEIYRITRLYSYLFFLIGILYFFGNVFFLNNFPSFLLIIGYSALFIIPLIYTLVFYISISSERPNYSFVINHQLILKILLIIGSFVIIPQILFYVLLQIVINITNWSLFIQPTDLLNFYFYKSFLIHEHIEIIPIGGILISNFFILRNYKINYPKFLFLVSGLFLLCYWMLEVVYLSVIYGSLFNQYHIISIISFIYDSFWILLLIIGMVFFVSSYLYLSRD